MRRGVILYGPPASGKDTVTAELSRRDPRFALLGKLKVGTGRSNGYRYVSSGELAKLREAGRLIVETHRYGNSYAVDRQDVEDLTDAGRVPVVHMGNLADLERLRSAVPIGWTVVLLWLTRQACAERSTARGDTDTAARLRAWDETDTDLRHAGRSLPFALTVHTDQTSPGDAAQQISAAVGI